MLDAERGRTDELEALGLVGNELEMKLAGFTNAFERFVMLGGVRALKKVLRWINLFLGSLASAVPGVDALKEVKEAVEIGIDEAEEVSF